LSAFVVDADVGGVEDGVVHLVADFGAAVEGVAGGAGGCDGGAGSRPAPAYQLVAAAVFGIAGAEAEEGQCYDVFFHDALRC